MTTRSVVAVSAGLSQPSSTRLLADRLAASAVAGLVAVGEDADVVVIELRELAHDIADAMLVGFPSPRLAEVATMIERADALVAVTPIFTSSYSGLFKSFFDVLDNRALDGMPTLLGATAGTARHSLALDYALRPMFAYLRAAVAPTGVFAASDDWGAGSADDALSRRIERAGHELARLVVTSDRTVPKTDTVVLDPSFDLAAAIHSESRPRRAA